MRTSTLCFRAASALLLATAAATPALAQRNGADGWAEPNDKVALALIEAERKWAMLSCLPNETAPAATRAFVEDFVAADFIATSPTATLYGKPEMLPRATPDAARKPDRDCTLLSAKVRFFGPDVAVIYGSDSRLSTGADGKEAKRTLVWTDTLMQRGGKWQLVAAQDMVGK